MSSTLLAIFLPFIIAIFLPFMKHLFKKIHIGWFVLLVPTSLFIYFVRLVKPIFAGNTYSYFFNWIPSFNIQFTTYIDGLSLLFSLLITGMGSLVVLYSIYYLSQEESLVHFYIYLLMFIGSMIGVVLTDHMMILYLFWEITSIASFLLIAFWYERKRSRYGALKSMLITVFGGLAMFAGFLMLYEMSGTFRITEIFTQTAKLQEHTLWIPALILILLGAFTKSSQFPFHIWLPDAMEAPTPVSAYLHSATMVKAGIYLVARFSPLFGISSLWFWLVSSIGLLTLLWGSLNAVQQRDLKSLLAYSTISQLGLVMTLLGIGSLAFVDGGNISTTIFTFSTFAALFHLVNHSTFKGTLFMVVGIIDLQVGTRDVVRLGGLLKYMPVTFIISLVGSFAMAGLPPFNGFLSKDMFFEAMLLVKQFDLFSLNGWALLFPIIAVIASIFTFLYCMIIVLQTFFGPYKKEAIEEEPKEASFGMLFSPSVLTLLIILIFFIPNTLGKYIITPAMQSIYPLFEKTSLTYEIKAWHGLNNSFFMTLIVVIVGIIFYQLYKKLDSIDTLLPDGWTIDTLFQKMLLLLERSGRMITRFYMTGNTRDYLVYIYLFFVSLTVGALIYFQAFDFSIINDAPIHLYEVVLTAVMMTAGISILFAKSRLVAIILNGVLGYSIALFFVIFRAPDLALTQLVIETVTTALFLLCFYFLPDIKSKMEKEKLNLKKLFISLSVGVVFTLIALSVNSGLRLESISTYFEKSEELTGAKNIVNTILGDFRAFDTMLEVIVLLISGIGVYTLVRLRLKRGEIEDEN